ncbi:HigA family addiction module antitoxin [Mesorhizobium sp. WSM3868]|uniref:HigA family addiction module antitoxin n=1 Tax=Mesorhizobium sp. WSM3868 TaxID=2029405 RepID=UPI000BB03B80|nr:HigA family addiction module antitoxin [Mesorhizobium sp. WSM3868]PBB35419.1 addiction module antidote protein, HigA family [Mesorhizobium sp. WSM3868]
MPKTMTDRVPAEAFPPGEFLKDALDDLGWSQTEFAEIIGRKANVVNEIIAGKRSITPDTAREIAAALDTTPQYWLNLESAYQLSRTSPADERIAREAEMRKRFPVRDLAKRGWLPQRPGESMEASVCRFFGIASISDPISGSFAAWRKRNNEEISTIQLAWLIRVKRLAEAMVVPKFSETLLRDALVQLEALMVDPEEVRHVPRILHECGVRFLVVEPLPGSRIDGVCFWLDKNRSPVIALSLKGGDQIDRFWFNLRHEIEHILRLEGRDNPVIDNFEDDDRLTDESERAADAAAADFCVPKLKMESFIRRHDPIYSKPGLIGFSKLVKRHPGIVAGQIQKHLNRWDLFKQYQAKVRHVLIRTAMTDGYGVTPHLKEI